MVPTGGISYLQTMNHVVKMLTPTNGISCLAQVQRQMMDMPLQRTIKRRAYYTMANIKCTKGQTTIYKTYTQSYRSSNAIPTKIWR